MALVSCPECGKQVSDRASTCPNCAFPLKGFDKLKINTQISNLPSPGLIKTVKIINSETGEILWEGNRGEVITLSSANPIPITVSYKGLTGKPARGLSKTVEPRKKYGVTFTPGMFFNPTYTLVEIDVIDLD